MSSEVQTKPTGVLRQLAVLVTGLVTISVGLYGGVLLAASAPAVVPLGAAAALAGVAFVRRPEDEWAARVIWWTVLVCALLLGLAGVMDAITVDS